MGPVVKPITQTEFREDLSASPPALRAIDWIDSESKFDVLEGRESGKQRMMLEDEPDPATEEHHVMRRQAGQLGVLMYRFTPWVLGNQLSSYDKDKIDLVFEIHDDLSNQPDTYAKRIKEESPYLIVGESTPIEGCERYPTEEVKKILGGEYLSSSIAYMIGYAILKEYEEIAIYGVDMAVADHEYFKQRPDLYAWIGYAIGKGIKITIPEESPLFKPAYIEGKQWGSGSDRGIKPFTEKDFIELAEAHKKRMKELEGDIRNLREHYASHKGASEIYIHMANIARGLEAGAKILHLKDVTRVN